MATDKYSAVARGLESGFNMARQAALDEENRRRTAVQEGREALRDDLAVKADRRAALADVAAEQHRVAAESRATEQAEQTRLGLGYQLARGRVADIKGEAEALIAGGADVTPELAQRYGNAKAQAQALYQKALNTMSRVQSGDTDLASLDPKELALTKALATGYKPEEMARVPQAIKDTQSAMDSQNWGMLIDPLNVILAPQLARGIGEPSYYGGNVEAKKLIKVVPAADANGKQMPEHVYPIIRVITDVKGEDGQNLYYDAPMTDDGSTGGRIAPVNIRKFMDYMGNLGVLTQGFAHPEIAGKIAQGEKEAAGEINRWITELRSVGKAGLASKNPTQQKIEAIRQYQVENNIPTFDEAAKRWQGLGLSPGGARQQTAAQEELTRARTAQILRTYGATSDAINETNKHLHGEEFLATLDPETQVKVRAIAEGKQSLNNESVRGGQKARIGALVAQYNSGYDSKAYPTAQATEKAFATGVEARKVRAFNVAIDHMDTLSKAARALNNGDTQALNKLTQAFKEQFGAAPPATFDALKQIVADEVVSGVVGNTGALADRQGIAASLRRESSPEQFAGVIEGFQELMGGQLTGLAKQYIAGGGSKDFLEAFLTERSRQLVPESTRRELATARRPIQPPPGGSPAAASSKYPEGAEAVNPQTGETLVRRGGKWVPK